MVNLHFGLGGHFTIHKGTLDDNDEPVTREYVTDFDNMVLDTGLQRIGINDDWMDWLHLGSGITAPAPLQNSLANATYKGNTLAPYSTLTPHTRHGVNTEDPLNPYCWITRVFRVPPRGENRTYAELGVGWNESNLFSRTLIKDPSGGQNTITILGDEYLDVTYEVRMYVPVDTAEYTVIPTGDDIEPRVISVSVSALNIFINTRTFGWGLGHFGEPGSLCGTYSLYEFQHNRFFDGRRGGIYQDPEGEVVGSTFNPASTVRTSDTSMTFNFSRDLQDNIGTLRTLQVSQLGYCFQMQFSPPFVKSNEERFNISYSISWGRA